MRQNKSILIFIFIFIIGYLPIVSANTPTQSEKSKIKTATTPSEYRETLQYGKKTPVKGLMARVIKGTSAEDFLSFSKDKKRLIVFFLGPQGLEDLLGLKGREILEKIGYTADYIDQLKRRNYSFKLVVFKQEESFLPATWDNVLQLAGKIKPQVLSKINHQLGRLKKGSFASIQGKAPFIFKDIYFEGRSHHDFMTFERYEKTSGNLWQTRALFYFEFRLTELFAGDGYTYDNKGKRQGKEYIGLNRPIKSLHSYEVIDLDI